MPCGIVIGTANVRSLSSQIFRKDPAGYSHFWSDSHENATYVCPKPSLVCLPRNYSVGELFCNYPILSTVPVSTKSDRPAKSSDFVFHENFRPDRYASVATQPRLNEPSNAFADVFPLSILPALRGGANGHIHDRIACDRLLQRAIPKTHFLQKVPGMEVVYILPWVEHWRLAAQRWKSILPGDAKKDCACNSHWTQFTDYIFWWAWSHKFRPSAKCRRSLWRRTVHQGFLWIVPPSSYGFSSLKDQLIPPAIRLINAKGLNILIPPPVLHYWAWMSIAGRCIKMSCCTLQTSWSYKRHGWLPKASMMKQNILQRKKEIVFGDCLVHQWRSNDQGVVLRARPLVSASKVV